MAITHRGFTVTRVPMLADNYAWLVEHGGAVAFIDPADGEAAIRATELCGGTLELVLLTHHHNDHIAGAARLATTFGAKLVGNAADSTRLPTLDVPLTDGGSIQLGGATIRMMATPGHTIGHVTFLFDNAVAACGDTLFSLGCGRMFEGNPAQFYASLQKLAALDPDTLMLCGHEYTLSNARFALTVDPENADLAARAAEVERLRNNGEPTLPVRLGDELKANPFLRAKSPAEFGRLRAAKDRA